MNRLCVQPASVETAAVHVELAQKDKNKMADRRHGERTMGGDRSLRGSWVSRLSLGSHGDEAFRYLLPVVVYGNLFPPGHQWEAFRD